MTPERRLVILIMALLMVLAAACGSHYSLRDGGWRLTTNPDVDGGTCLTVHGDGDDRVMTVCIDRPDPLSISSDVLRPLCRQIGGG